MDLGVVESGCGFCRCREIRYQVLLSGMEHNCMDEISMSPRPGSPRDVVGVIFAAWRFREIGNTRPDPSMVKVSDPIIVSVPSSVGAVMAYD